MTGPLITLTSDFGTRDGYVGAVKGVILALNPDARIIDITHEIAPQGIAQAAFVTSTVWPHFPAEAIHYCVVDPGVGTHRRALVLRTGHGCFVGPDNGVLSAALPDAVRAAVRSDGTAPLPEGVEAYALENPAYRRERVSRTFHGRDVFAPAAGHLSLGVEPESFGPRVEAIRALPPFRALPGAEGTLGGRVIHVDYYGNLVTDVRASDLPSGDIVVAVAGHEVRGPVPTFAAGQGLLAYVGSVGYLEIALRDGNAAAALGAAIGDAVLVRPAARRG